MKKRQKNMLNLLNLNIEILTKYEISNIIAMTDKDFLNYYNNNMPKAL